MIKRKQPKRNLTQDVEVVHRWGCGCLLAIIFGVIVSMIVAGAWQGR